MSKELKKLPHWQVQMLSYCHPNDPELKLEILLRDREMLRKRLKKLQKEINFWRGKQC